MASIWPWGCGTLEGVYQNPVCHLQVHPCIAVPALRSDGDFRHASPPKKLRSSHTAAPQADDLFQSFGYEQLPPVEGTDFELAMKGLQRVVMPGRGNCLFHAFAAVLFKDPSKHMRARHAAVHYIDAHPDDFFEEICRAHPFWPSVLAFEARAREAADAAMSDGGMLVELRQDVLDAYEEYMNARGSWGDELEIRALVRRFPSVGHATVYVSAPGSLLATLPVIGDPAVGCGITLLLEEHHYDLVVPLDLIRPRAAPPPCASSGSPAAQGGQASRCTRGDDGRPSGSGDDDDLSLGGELPADIEDLTLPPHVPRGSGPPSSVAFSWPDAPQTALRLLQDDGRKPRPMADHACPVLLASRPDAAPTAPEAMAGRDCNGPGVRVDAQAWVVATAPLGLAPFLAPPSLIVRGMDIDSVEVQGASACSPQDAHAYFEGLNLISSLNAAEAEALEQPYTMQPPMQEMPRITVGAPRQWPSGRTALQRIGAPSPYDSSAPILPPLNMKTPENFDDL